MFLPWSCPPRSRAAAWSSTGQPVALNHAASSRSSSARLHKSRLGRAGATHSIKLRANNTAAGNNEFKTSFIWPT
eukprot:8831937-Pyramimonas_sp.AAC.1